VAKVVLVSAITPYMIQNENNPDGVPLAVLMIFDLIQSIIELNFIKI
jgi:hypothetical protein